MSRNDLIKGWLLSLDLWRGSIGAGEFGSTEVGTIGANGATWIQTLHWLLLRYYAGIHTSRISPPLQVFWGQNQFHVPDQGGQLKWCVNAGPPSGQEWLNPDKWLVMDFPVARLSLRQLTPGKAPGVHILWYTFIKWYSPHARYVPLYSLYWKQPKPGSALWKISLKCAIKHYMK